MTRRFVYGFGVILAFLLGLLVPCPEAIEREYVAAPIVHEHESPDHANRFFDLSFGTDDSDTQTTNAGIPHVGVLTAKDSPLAEWLASHDGQRIALSLRAGGTFARDGIDTRSGPDEQLMRDGRVGHHVEAFDLGQHPLRAEVTQ